MKKYVPGYIQRLFSSCGKENEDAKQYMFCHSKIQKWFFPYGHDRKMFKLFIIPSYMISEREKGIFYFQSMNKDGVWFVCLLLDLEFFFFVKYRDWFALSNNQKLEVIPGFRRGDGCMGVPIHDR